MRSLDSFSNFPKILTSLRSSPETKLQEEKPNYLFIYGNGYIFE